MTRWAPMRAGSRGVVGVAAVVIAIGLAAGCGSSDDTTSAADDTTETTTETTITSTESSTDETSTSGCPVGGSGDCTMSIRCPEGDYDLEIGRADATTAIIVAARPTVAPPATNTTTNSTDTTPTDSTPTASAPTPPPVLSVGAEVAARIDRDESGEAGINTLCADGVTTAVPTPGG